MKNWNAFFILTLFIMSCSTIKITEKDAFDVKRTISPEYFKDGPTALTEVRFVTPDNIALNGWFIQNEAANGTILYFGGNGFVRVTSYHLIKAIIDQKVNLFVFDYRGYGANPGTPSVAGLKADGLAAYDFLIQGKKVRPEELILHGHSLGTFIATFVAAQKEAAGIVLECPITDAKDWTGRLVPWFLKPFVKFQIDAALLENSNLERISQVSQPLLILAGGKDQITPPVMAEKLFEKAKSQNKALKIIATGGHNDLPQIKEYRQVLQAFYQKVFVAGE
ncbi:alpha/beta hydrolase [Candidatus Poribacteria bacterium]|nr:alpha/beta hydrolase [Candidatus Poribacteria bacterium]